MARFLWSAARGEFGYQRFAQFRSPAAAVLDQESRYLSHTIDHRPVDDGPALTLGFDEPGACQDGQVRGHRVLRHLKAPSYIASRQTFRPMLHKETERVETRGLGKSGENVEGLS